MVWYDRLQKENTMTKNMGHIEDNRQSLGKKERYATYIREQILEHIKGCAAKSGIPITRVIENALLLYLEMDDLTAHLVRLDDDTRSLDEVCTMIGNRILNESR